jgi:hypothetical protein
VAVDAFGNLYISERLDGFAQSSGNYIRKVSGGTIYTIAGNGNRGSSGDGGPATSAELDNPLGLAVASNGNVYVADGRANLVRQLTPSSEVIAPMRPLVGPATFQPPSATRALPSTARMHTSGS